MIQRLLLLLVGLWLLPFNSTTAQVGFSLPVINNAQPGTIVTLPVKVSNFDSIVGAQFVIQWDSQILNFLTVLAYNLPGMSNEDFGLGSTSSGILRFAWEGLNVNYGHSVPDGTSIFLMKFSVIGENNQGSAVIFTEDVPTTVFEVVQAGHPPYGLDDCDISNGYVAVGFTLSTDWIDEPNSLPATVSPNPFQTSSTVQFELENSSAVQLVLTDAAGHPVFEKKMALPAGRHGIEIASEQLPKSGIYYLILRTPSRSCIRPLVKL